MKIEVLQKGQVVNTLDLGDGSYKVGRAAEADISLKSPQISKQHAMLVIKDGRLAIIDMGSSNGVFVNGILVKKQRVEIGDEIGIADYRLRIARPQRREAPRVQGNLAMKSEPAPAPAAVGAPQAAPQPKLPPQEQIVALMDEKILVPFYATMKRVDWRILLGSILALSMVTSVLLSVIPFVRWGQRITTEESLRRAHTILAQVVRENYRVLSKTNDYTRLTVEAGESEKGMLAMFIVDPRANTVMAPAKHYNKPVDDIYGLLAMRKIQEGEEDQVSVEKSDSEYIVAQPLYVFSAENNEKTLVGVVLADFEVNQGVTSTFEPTVEAALFSMLLALAAFYFVSKMVAYPLGRVGEQLDAALKGESVEIVAEAKLPELEALVQTINFSVSRMQQAGGGIAAAPTASLDTQDEDKHYEDAVREFDQGSSDALILLDGENKVRFVGKILEDLIGMRNQYAIGQNVSEACRDQSFAGTCLDMAERVRSSLGQMQTANLDINGIARTIIAFGHRNSAGQISHVVVMAKMA